MLRLSPIWNRVLTVFTTLTMVVLSSLAFANEEKTQAPEVVPTYIFFYGTGSDVRRPYEEALVKLVFELSREKYGPFNLEIPERPMSLKRALKNLKYGKGVHLMISPYLNQYLDQEAVIVLPYLVLKNLLGYRQLIVRREDVDSFKNIDSRKVFAVKNAGQVSEWGDIAVFKHNDFPVVEAPRFEGLFTMLKYKRFDYISLGVSEARDIFTIENLDAQGFVLLDNIFLYYPWPVHMMVSSQHPELAERLDYGMKKAIENGQFDLLFNKFFRNVMDSYNKSSTKVIHLNTPRVSSKFDLSPVLLNKARVLE